MQSNNMKNNLINGAKRWINNLFDNSNNYFLTIFHISAILPFALYLGISADSNNGSGIFRLCPMILYKFGPRAYVSETETNLQ
jgi:hypothetical protein